MVQNPLNKFNYTDKPGAKMSIAEFILSYFPKMFLPFDIHAIIKYSDYLIREKKLLIFMSCASRCGECSQSQTEPK